MAGRNVTLELRYGEGALERLAPLVSETHGAQAQCAVYRRQGGVALAVHSVTQAIPIVIVTPEDPMLSGLVEHHCHSRGEMSPGHGFSGTTLWSGTLELLPARSPGPSPALAIAPPIPTTQATA